MLTCLLIIIESLSSCPHFIFSKGKTTLLKHIANRALSIPPNIDVLLCEQGMWPFRMCSQIFFCICQFCYHPLTLWYPCVPFRGSRWWHTSGAGCVEGRYPPSETPWRRKTAPGSSGEGRGHRGWETGKGLYVLCVCVYACKCMYISVTWMKIVDMSPLSHSMQLKSN